MRVTPAAVTAKALTLGYDEAVAISEASFTLPSGKVTAIIGPNGSGKSTLLKCIAGLIKPISGSLDVAAPPGRVALVLQSTSVNENLPVTVREVVAMGRYPAVGFFKRYTPADRGAIDAAMRQAGITGLSSRQLHTLSGGQRQRVLVAQGLAQEHDLLLLDEPFTGIDLPTARAIDDMIYQERNQDRTIVITTHDLTEARHADHVLLVAGKLVAEGPPAEVITSAHLAVAYGGSLLHPDEDDLYMDDPAHRPASGRRFGEV